MAENCKIIEVPNNLKPVMPLMNPVEAKAAWELYEKVKGALLSAGDYQAIGGKQYIKRSGFRKIAVAFGISDTIISEERLNRDDPEHSFVWRVKVGVSAPNGRSAVGVGACDSKERNFAHLEHDVYSTAHTRAKSRAISDLVAGGALSAEELADDEATPRNAPLNVTPPKETVKFSVQALDEDLIQVNLLEQIDFNLEPDTATLKTRCKLEKEDFIKVCRIAEKYGGKWVKENGVWTIPAST